MSEGCEARVASAYAVLMLGSGWLLTRLWCFLGLPQDCDLADDGIDLIANIVVLLAFGIAQVSESLPASHHVTGRRRILL